MVPPAHACLFLAGFSLIGGLLTLTEGHAPALAAVELLMAVISAVVSLRVPAD